MNKKMLCTALVAFATAIAACAADKNPVLMTIDGKDIHVSEFEYLYNKNKAQQVQPQTIDEYLQMFINYKLKVAEAEQEKLDQRPEFVSEFNQFCSELAVPFLSDKSVEDSLVQLAYTHYLEDLTASHIMLPVQPGNEVRLDSIRTAILNGTLSFSDAAARYSVDRGSSGNGGKMGYVVPGRFPWSFEQAAYSLPVGEISPVVNSGVGYHIIRTDSRRPAQGEVSADHILLMTQRLSTEQIAAKKETADSIYAVLVAGGDFADLASRYSEDPGSARRGGSLGWFGRGAMVEPFDSVAFALPDGVISEPFLSPFGYHIVRKVGHRDVPGIDAIRPAIVAAMANDSRSDMPRRVVLDSVARDHNVVIDEDIIAWMRNEIMSSPKACDSAVYARIRNNSTPVISSADGNFSFSTILATPGLDRFSVAKMSPARAAAAIDEATRKTYDNLLISYAQDGLLANNPNYRNLVGEYRDGILLYDISNANVWEKASKDREGLENYFKANAAKYAWDEPKFKAIVIFATGDSLLDAACAYAESLADTPDYKLPDAVRTKFPKGVKVDRVIAAKGENAITDYLGFGAEKPAADAKSHWKVYKAIRNRVIRAPEEASDVKGTALTDYQGELDRQWVEDLHKRHKVKLNKKVFEKLKKQ